MEIQSLSNQVDSSTEEVKSQIVTPSANEVSTIPSLPKVNISENPLILSDQRIEQLKKIQSEATHLNAGLHFNSPSLKIPQPILEALTIDMRFEKPSQIQAETIPRIINGRDLIAQAQSGAGKTVAFTVGLLSRIDPHKRFPQALVLTPTRELAIQIYRDAVIPLSKRLPNVDCLCAIQGTDPARGELCDKQVIVGTPGTVKKFISFRFFNPKLIDIFVLDEADTMVENSQQARSLGVDTIGIKRMLRDDCQTLFFSATFSEEVMKFSKSIIKPGVVVIRPPSVEDLMLDVIFQVRINVAKHREGKLGILKDIYDFMTIEQSIVFVEKKETANEVARTLQSEGLQVSLLHGDIEKSQRDTIMEMFRKGESKVLITTNVLARGVDVPSVAVVVNYDIPTTLVNRLLVGDYTAYLHRIGRCGRFGRLGTAINFIDSPESEKCLEAIEMFYRPNNRITKEWDPNDIEGLKDAINNRVSNEVSNVTIEEPSK